MMNIMNTLKRSKLTITKILKIILIIDSLQILTMTQLNPDIETIQIGTMKIVTEDSDNIKIGQKLFFLFFEDNLIFFSFFSKFFSFIIPIIIS
jgi:hypothetical protein